MKIIQYSVIKDACSTPFGQIDALFSELADGYVVGVDSSSTDGTYDKALRALRVIKKRTEKPFELYRFKWSDDFGKALNVALDRAEKMGADWTLRIDADTRVAKSNGMRDFLADCERTIIKVPCLTLYGGLRIGNIHFPVTAMKAYWRFDGKIFETPEYPRSMILDDRETSQCGALISKKSGRDAIDEDNRRARIMYDEASRIYSEFHRASCYQDIFRVASRLHQLGIVMTHDQQSATWRHAAKSLFKRLAKEGYQPGDCYHRIGVMHELEGDLETAEKYMEMAHESIPAPMERYERQTRESNGIQPVLMNDPVFIEGMMHFY